MSRIDALPASRATRIPHCRGPAGERSRGGSNTLAVLITNGPTETAVSGETGDQFWPLSNDSTIPIVYSRSPASAGALASGPKLGHVLLHPAVITATPCALRTKSASEGASCEFTVQSWFGVSRLRVLPELFAVRFLGVNAFPRRFRNAAIDNRMTFSSGQYEFGNEHPNVTRRFFIHATLPQNGTWPRLLSSTSMKPAQGAAATGAMDARHPQSGSAASNERAILSMAVGRRFILVR